MRSFHALGSTTFFALLGARWREATVRAAGTGGAAGFMTGPDLPVGRTRLFTLLPLPAEPTLVMLRPLPCGGTGAAAGVGCDTPAV